MLNQFLNFLKSPIQSSGVQTPYNNQVEAYRGLCAILVVLSHGMVYEYFLLDNFIWPSFVHYLNSGYLSVLVFFCISGYVIGITNHKASLNISTYLKKRAVRLYPIYLISIVLCLFTINQFLTQQIIGNILFLQTKFSYFGYQILILQNVVTWSLNYEVLYYLLFIGLMFTKPKVWVLLLIMLAISIIFKQTSNQTIFLVDYLNGFYFWLLGLLFGWHIIGSKNVKINPIALLSILFLHLCQSHLGVGKIILNFIGFPSNNGLSYLFDLPFCLMVMASLTNNNNTFLKINKAFTYLLPLIIFSYLIATHRVFEDIRWIMCLIFWALSLLFYQERKISAILSSKLIFFGQISYALYLFHVPVALLINRYLIITNKPTEITVKYSLWIILTIALSYLAEKILQPKIKSYFFKNEKPINSVF